MPTISLASTPPRLSPGLPLAPGSCEMHGQSWEPLAQTLSFAPSGTSKRPEKGMHHPRGKGPGTSMTLKTPFK